MMKHPFIDITVHPLIRKSFVEGKAVALLSKDMRNLLWTNGIAANLFGYSSIYNFLNKGLNHTSVYFRQLQTAVNQLKKPGDLRNFIMLIAFNFQNFLIQVTVEMISLKEHEVVILLVASLENSIFPKITQEQHMILGLDNSNINVIALGNEGQIIAASPHFIKLKVNSEATQLMAMCSEKRSRRLIKQPILIQNNIMELPLSSETETNPLHSLKELTKEISISSLENFDTGNKDNLQTQITGMNDQEQTPETLSEEIKMQSQQSTEFESMKINTIDHLNQEIDNKTPFTFNAQPRVVRFVWKVNAQTCFCEISKELPETIGPYAASIIGINFNDLNVILNLDPEGHIPELLKQQNTWSIENTYWPIENTDLKVPIDFAALPTYTRDRKFDGFRGFGIIRISEAITDSLKTGLMINNIFNSLAEKIKVKYSYETNANLPQDTSFSLIPKEIKDKKELSLLEQQNPFLSNSDDISEKIILFSKYQMLNFDTLSHSGKDALEDSSNHLRKNDNSDVLNSTPNTNTHNKQINTQETTALHQPIEKNQSSQKETFKYKSNCSVKLPKWVHEGYGLSVDNIDSISIPLLIYSGHRIYYTNLAFLILTGYKSHEEIETAGGLSKLLEPQHSQKNSEHSSTISILCSDGTFIPVSVRLHSILWEGQKLLSLTVVPLIEEYEYHEPNNIAPKYEKRIKAYIHALETEITQLNSILETASNGIVIISPDRKIQSINHPATLLFNYTSEEINGKSFTILFSSESQKIITDYLDDISTDNAFHLLNQWKEVFGRKANGDSIPIFLTIKKLLSSSGYYATLQDVVQLKHNEEAV
ncbi:putative two-component sensor histidine kinase protein [Liberibacter crescens BT-1]|uniref:Putative two-component sensor histidine kinase protein n=1 Tax=Liberibacter crescens (strain BT-1) TaxID=1215343 RepID=L0ERQ0_LIBCB|nr:PAS domain-containing protein [Liberibacter crescens]AGA64169.1 putative two-component sensor histidine kinase protein [Liberibacter crescens BT-1]AMC12433.1 hypothetical protein RL73_01055 [Liberibacter crescens]